MSGIVVEIHVSPGPRNFDDAQLRGLLAAGLGGVLDALATHGLIASGFSIGTSASGSDVAVTEGGG